MGLRPLIADSHRMLAVALLLASSLPAQAAGAVELYHANQAQRLAVNCLASDGDGRCLPLLQRYVDASAPLLAAEHQPLGGQLLRLRNARLHTLTAAMQLRERAVAEMDPELQREAVSLEQIAARMGSLLGLAPSAPEPLQALPEAETAVRVVELIAPATAAPQYSEDDAAGLAKPALPTTPAEYSDPIQTAKRLD